MIEWATLSVTAPARFLPMNLARAGLVFAAAALSDVVWATWTLTVNKRQAVAAATSAVGIVLLSAVGILAYVESAVYLVPAGLGAAVGTFFTVRQR